MMSKDVFFAKQSCVECRMVDMRSESGFTPLHFAVSASNATAGQRHAKLDTLAYIFPPDQLCDFVCPKG